MATEREDLELNPAHVSEQRRVAGRRRVTTDAIDLEAITELALAGRGVPVLARDDLFGELAGCAGLRRRRIATRTATRNQMLSRLDRSFSRLTVVVRDALSTQVDYLILAEFPDPARLTSLGNAPFKRLAANRGLRVSRTMADRLVQAARDWLPMRWFG